MADTAHTMNENGIYDSERSRLTVAEVHDIETDKVLRVTFTCFDSNGTAWFGQVSGVRKYDLSNEDYQRLLEPVPDAQAYPLAPPGLTVLDIRNTAGHYIKRANLIGFDDAEMARTIPQILLDEAKILEFLKQHHQPNLVKYYGCVLKGDRIAGLVLEKYPKTLQQHVEWGPCGLGDSEVTRWMTGLRAGIDHLHSLELAHNDLNPMNIALDKNNNVVILDFGSCRRFGEELVSAGTPGWFDDDSRDWAISAKAHDEFALRRIESWLESEGLRRRDGERRIEPWLESKRLETWESELVPN